jgi:hypothetical protein
MHSLAYYIVGFFWSLFTGFVFSTVGAAGGILSSFGFITILGIKDANSVKVMSQIIVIVSPLIALTVYLRQERVKQIRAILLSVALIIASGAVMGALLGSWFSKNYLFEIKSFKYIFGYLTFAVVALMVYNIIKQRNKKKPENNKAGKKNDIDSDNDKIKESKEGRQGKEPQIVRFSFNRLDFRCLNKDYFVSPVFLFASGFTIALISSIFGVGGGFLIVPFLTDIIGVPIFLAAGISILVVLISSLTSASNYIRMGVAVILPILLVMIAGVIIGSILGPKISQRMNEKALKYILMVLLIFIGIFYVFKP